MHGLRNGWEWTLKTGMSNTVQDNSICRILPDDEIYRAVDREIRSMERPFKSMVLTWEKVRGEYHLEIVLTEEAAEDSVAPARRCVTVGRVGECEYDALNKLLVAGRRLFLRLKKDFPMLRCKLSIYRFLPKGDRARTKSQQESGKRLNRKGRKMPSIMQDN